MGPLGKLWRKLDEARKSKRDSELNLQKALDLTEESIMLVGQANVAIRHARRVEMTHTITKDLGEARNLVRRFDKYREEGVLFGAEFQKKIQEEKEETRAGLLALGAPPKRHRHDKFKSDRRPFREEPARFDRPERGGYNGGPRGRGGRGQGRGQTRGRGTSRKRYVHLSFSPPKPEPKSKSVSCSKSGNNPRSRKQANDLSILLVQNHPSTPRNRETKFDPPSDKSGENCGSGKGSSRKLVKDHLRQDNSKDGSGLLDPVHRQPARKPQDIPAQFLKPGKNVDIRRNRKNETKGCDTRSTPCPTPIPGPHLPETKERRLTKADIQFKEAEPLCPVPTFQNGGTDLTEELATTRRLDAETGPQGCLFLRANDGTTEETPAVRVGNETLRIPVPTFRPSVSSKRLYEADETGGWNTTQDRGQSDNLPRRPAHNEPMPGPAAEGRQDYQPFAGEPRVRSQRGEVTHDTNPRPRIPGHDNQLALNDDEAVGRENMQDSESVPDPPATRQSVSEGPVEADRDVVIHGLGSTASKTILQGATTAKNSSAEQEAILCNPDNPYSTMQGRAEMVDMSFATSEWQGDENPPTGHDNRHGCMPHRLGGSHQWSRAKRPLDNRGEAGTNQRPGAASNPPHSQSHVEGEVPHPCSFQSRQHDGSVPYQQDGGDALSSPDKNRARNMGILLQEEDTDISRIPSREHECPSRQIVTRNTRLERLATGSTDGQTSDETMGQMQNGFICQQVEHPATAVRELQARPRRDGGGRFPNKLERGSPLCLPTLLPDWQVLGKSTQRQSRADHHNPDLAHPTVVWNDPEHDHDTANPAPITPENAAITHRCQPPVGGEQLPPASGMESFRRQQEARGISQQSANLISKSWRTGTRTAYNSAWNKWSSWCTERDIDPFQSPVEPVIDYLTSLFQAGYEYNTINGARSAISSLHAPIGGDPVGQHSLVKRLMTGAFNERTPKPRYTDTWDVDQVLTFISSLGENGNLSDKQLIHKLTMLIALSSANRASEVQGLNLEYMKDEGDYMEFTINKLTKTRRVGDKPQVVTFHQYEDPVLDVTTCLRAYITRTAHWRKSRQHHQLLLGIVAPHKPVCTSTISNWLKQMMAAAGIDTTVYKGHSVRSAATSKASASGLSLEEILRRANWKRASTFQKYYNRGTPEPTDGFAQTVLTLKKL